jgi:predicted site-specific integrase-resolvase
VDEPEDDTELRMKDATALSGWSRMTLVRHADAGKLDCTRTPGGHRRFWKRTFRRQVATIKGLTGVTA